MRALFVDVLFPEVGIAYDPVANRVAAPVADDTLDQFVRLVEAVFTDATVVSAWQAAPPQFFHYTDRSFTTALYVLRYPPDTPISVKRDMMRSLLSNLPPLPLPPPPPMAPAPAVIVLSDADEDVNDAMDEEDCETVAEWESDAPVVPVPAVPAPPAPVPAPAVRLAINRIGPYLLGSRMGPERRPLGEPEVRAVMAATGLIVMY
jgi:hypothetical protein